jgi:hypothetical protein
MVGHRLETLDEGLEHSDMSCDFEAMFGEIVGKGAQATVYAKGEHAVKLYRDGYPKRNVFIEAYVMANLELVNFPGPFTKYCS